MIENGNECEYREFTIHSHNGPSIHMRWIHAPEDYWIDPIWKGDSRKYSVEDCKRIIDTEIQRRNGNDRETIEQLSLF